jgi:hypothetical protein
MKKQIAVIAIVIGSAVALARADTLLVAADVETQPLLATMSTQTPLAQRVAFEGKPIRVEVQAVPMPLRRGAQYPPGTQHTVRTFNGPWWKSVSLEFELISSGARVIYSGASATLLQQISDNSNGSGSDTIRDDEIVTVYYEVPPLPVGEYRLHASITSRTSDGAGTESFRSEPTDAFFVRRGDEDVVTRRALLRSEAKRIESTPAPDRFERFSAVVMELVELEPTNPANYEWLGDVAASTRPASEVKRYYATALRMVEQNITEKFGSRNGWPASVQERWETRKRALTVFDRAVASTPDLDGVVLHVQNEGGVKRVLIFRRGDTRRQRVVE